MVPKLMTCAKLADKLCTKASTFKSMQSLGKTGSLLEVETASYASLFRRSGGAHIPNAKTPHTVILFFLGSTASELFTKDEIPRGPRFCSHFGPSHRASCVLALAILSEEAMWLALIAWPHRACPRTSPCPRFGPPRHPRVHGYGGTGWSCFP